MFDQVKCLRHVHQATVHIATIPEEVVDSLDHRPGAHIGRDARLVGKLEIINSKTGSEEDEALIKTSLH